MPVTKQISDLRRQLAEDRVLCANSQLAQQYLDGAETKLDEVEESFARRNPLEYLNAIVDECEIGADTVNCEELRAMVSDILEWEHALENIEDRTTPHYTLAEKYLRAIKRNYIALYQKNRLADLLSADAVDAKPE